MMFKSLVKNQDMKKNYFDQHYNKIIYVKGQKSSSGMQFTRTNIPKSCSALIPRMMFI